MIQKKTQQINSRSINERARRYACTASLKVCGTCISGLLVKEHMRIKRKKHTLLIICTLILIALVVIVIDSKYRIVINEYELEYSELPSQFDGFRIVQVSDLHCMEFGKANSYLLKKVEQAQPDIIAITGDIIDRNGEEEYARELFSALVDIAPSYYVTGNHEWAIDDTYELLSLIRECGVTVLQNEYEIIEKDGAEIAIVGLDDPNGRADMERPEQVMERLRAQEGNVFTVLLNHRNRTPESLYPLSAQLILSGHAHGGLIRLPFTDGLIDASRTWFPDNTSGVYEYGGMKLLVSRGLGNSVIVPRFLNNPHLPVAILKKA